jgi:tRNA-binding EMAP/Myf-like protein
MKCNRANEEKTNLQKTKKEEAKKIYKSKLHIMSRKQLRELICQRVIARRAAKNRQDKIVGWQYIQACLNLQEYNCTVCL